VTIKFKETGPTVSDAAVDDFEMRHDRSIPVDYRQFLVTCNGGVPEHHVIRDTNAGDLGVQLFYGIWDREYFDIDVENRRMRGRWPDRFLSIAIDDGGNRFLLSVDAPDYGSVWYWDHEQEAEEDEEPTEENLYHVADSFADFWERIEPIDRDVYLAEIEREQPARKEPPPAGEADPKRE
jgi:hypothetical protein